VTFSDSPSFSRELRKSSGRPPEKATPPHGARQYTEREEGRDMGGGLRARDSPSSSLVKDRLVVSSFRFLLKSMQRLLSFFLMVLISCHSRVKY